MTLDRLRIGIDGYNLALPNGTGIATYGFTLARMLRDSGCRVDGIFGIDAGADPALREVLFFEELGRTGEIPKPVRRRWARRAFWAAASPFASANAMDVTLTGKVEKGGLADRFPAFDRLTTSPLLFRIAHRHFAHYGRFLPLRMVDPPQIMHWTYPVPVELVGARNIYTLHDIIPLRLPYTTLDQKKRYRKLVAECVARASQICTVSETSRRDIVEEFGVDPNRITNTYQSAPLPAGFLDRSAEEDAAAVEGIFGLPRHGYFLFFGAIEPKKNVGRLVEAYLSLTSQTPLVIVSGRAWQSDGELALLNQIDQPDSEHGRNLSARVIRIEHLAKPLLLRLIRGARAVIFPSLYEGFGLPALEAMQLGTPVLASTGGSLPEVTGEAALLIDPYDTQAIAAGLHALDVDQDLRARLARMGPQEATRFSEENYRDRLQRLYESALSAPR